jgi:hypothetical protein
MHQLFSPEANSNPVHLQEKYVGKGQGQSPFLGNYPVFIAKNRALTPVFGNKKAAGFAAGGFSVRQQRKSAADPINASRIALRDVLCADQLSYARLHGRHG